MSKSFDPNTKLRIYHIFDLLQLNYKNKDNESIVLELIDGLPENQINIPNEEEEYSLLMYLVIRNYTKCVEKVLSLYPNIDINYRTNKDEGPIHIYTSALIEAIPKSTKIIELLLNHPKIDVNITDEDGNTPLHLLCERNTEINKIKLLLNHPNININAQNKRGNTPLHINLCKGNIKISELLLENPGIDVNIQNYREETPIMNFFSGRHQWPYPKQNRDLIKKIYEGDKYDKKIKNYYGETFFDMLFRYLGLDLD